MRHVTVCCSVLQCAAVCCSVLQCVAVICSVLQCVACHIKYHRMRHVAVRECVCVMSQGVAVSCMSHIVTSNASRHVQSQVERSEKGRTAVLFIIFTTLYMSAIVLQRNCRDGQVSILMRHDMQHTATHCNTLQHTATHCITDVTYSNIECVMSCVLQRNCRDEQVSIVSILIVIPTF